MKQSGVFVFLLWAFVLSAWSAQPVVSNIRASQRAGTKLVDIYYDVSDADGHSQTVQVYVSGDNGLTYRIPAVTFTGAVGANVAPGVNKHIVWDAGRDWNGQFVGNTKVRIVCNDGTTPIPPLNMVYIPAGPFQMGDNFSELGDNTRPVHTVEVDGFFMDKFEVSGALWDDVRSWSLANSYGPLSGGYTTTEHPVRDVTWYAAAKWCNARSEKEGLIPVYCTDAARTQIYRNGEEDITNVSVRWDVNGYRLPTEAEWEKAARGGLTGQRYPWGDTVGESNANYRNSGDPFGNYTTPCGYYNGNQTPAGPDMGNGYGLYDMAGNVWEWCWDRYDSAYYGRGDACDNPKGPDTGGRVMRGGSWFTVLGRLRCADRDSNYPGDSSLGSNIDGDGTGFRCVRGR